MAATAWNSCLYEGRVMHSRLAPFRHKFAYRVFSLLLDLDELPRLDRDLPGFGHNRFALLGFHDRDHGPRDGSPLRPWVEAHLARGGIDLKGGRISLLCFPRLLGYVFNPLSVYFCRDADGRLRAILYEVKNTFGDQHGYLLPVGPAHAPGELIVQQQDKSFYVSPFMPMDCRYRFRLKEPGERLSIMIRQDSAGDDAAELFVATHTAERRELTGRALAAAFWRHPLMTIKIFAGIHWEALRVWRKGAVFHARPVPPSEAVSIWRPSPSIRSQIP
ncbi:DUF1365 domain-containing protein [Oceanibaculum pacificum]|uniref:DUF1365 domain-containing protein n=1 Tax=Oceanibaculum pacificum TaxID=580166 RepID=A0A154VNG1_9PROT|nr:DUF1365 domain-containing protein [Oceanibaculum pacificum]KZD02778.1 hypothetical protein AUP43_13545 [Oceanibaculum pacificum]